MEWHINIAIIGSGISGLLATRLLADDHGIHIPLPEDWAYAKCWLRIAITGEARND